MFRNHLKSAFRYLLKHRLFSIISILGLAASLACCLLMLLYIQDELSFDRFHPRAERTYRIGFEQYIDLGSFATTPLPIGPAIAEDFPEIESMTRVTPGMTTQVSYGEKRFFEEAAFVDPGLLDIFKIEILQGQADSALWQPNQAIISESFAQKYFGEENPIGKLLEIGSKGSLNSTVAAVFRGLPRNSTLQIDIALPFATFEKVWGQPGLWRQMPSNYTFIQLKESASAEALAAKLPDWAARRMAGELDDPRQQYRLQLQPLLSLHLHSQLSREMGEPGSVKVLILLGSISLIVLLIACFNYVNFTTARYLKRAKEAGIRKVMGATTRTLAGQFLSEAALIALAAGVIAMAIAGLLLPSFNALSGKAFTLTDVHQGSNYLWMLASLGLLTLGGGAIPTLLVARFKLSNVLRGRISRQPIATLSRKTLITLQFSAAITLLVASWVIFQQMRYTRNAILPESESNLAVFQINSRLAEKYTTLQEQLQGHAAILQVTAASNMPTFYGDSWPVSRTTDGTTVQTENYAVENDFVATMGYEMAAGRPLDLANATDREKGFVINETAVRRLGFESNETALGQTLYWGGEDKKEGVVLGVVKDFHFQSLHHKIEPALLQASPREWMTSQFVAVRFIPGQVNQVQKAIQEAVATVDPSWTASPRYMDEHFAAMHRKDQQQGQIFGAFALLALIISCFGLLGLAAYAAEQRTKEVGIRKILGATVSQIILLFYGEFFRLLVLAFIIAAPLAWLGMHYWLENFAYATAINAWPFLAAALLVLLLALITVGTQSARLAMGHPSESLRYE